MDTGSSFDERRARTQERESETSEAQIKEQLKQKLRKTT